MLHPNIVKRASSIAGLGLYATGPIRAGDVIWAAEADERERYWRHISEIKTWPADVQRTFMMNAYQVADGVYSGVPPGETSPDDAEYMNHSCEPNCAFVGDDAMHALRDIAAGEEITYDYSTSEYEGSAHLPFPCSCGAASCRGTISPAQWRDAAFQCKFAGHFTTRLQSLIDAHKVKEAQITGAAEQPSASATEE